MSNRTLPPTHWYRQVSGTCPICMRVIAYRERVYGEPPADREERYAHLTSREAARRCAGNPAELVA